MSGVFGEYIPESALTELKQYKYRCAPSTYLDNLFNYWWTYCTEFLPKSIAPNVVTLLGFVCTVCAVLLVFVKCPTLDCPLHPMVHFLLSGFLFAHFTLDGMDGKQARRTNSSSPLGQLFDHGCDSFSLVFWGLIILSGLQCGLGATTYVLLTLMQMQMMCYTWMELHLKVYSCNTFALFGVTEGQLCVMLFHLIMGFARMIFQIPENVFTSTRISLGSLAPEISLNLLMLIPFFIVIPVMSVCDSVRCVKNAKVPLEATTQLLFLLLHNVFQSLFYFSCVMSSWPSWGFIAITFGSSIIAIRMQLSAIAKMNYSPVQWVNLPFYVIATLFYFDIGGIGARAKFVMLLALIVWQTIYLGDMIVTSTTTICDSLSICCFSVTKPKTSISYELRQKRAKKKK